MWKKIDLEVASFSAFLRLVSPVLAHRIRYDARMKSLLGEICSDATIAFSVPHRPLPRLPGILYLLTTFPTLFPTRLTFAM